MKIRNGFVSNSSSSSFIVNINMNKNDLIKLILENSEILDAYSIKNDLDLYKNNPYCSKEVEKLLINIEEDDNHFLKILKLKNNIDSFKFYEDYLKFKNIYIEENKLSLTIKEWISMMNTYTDFSNIMKDIIFILNCCNKEYTINIEED
jgi:hypothetical protein